MHKNLSPAEVTEPQWPLSSRELTEQQIPFHNLRICSNGRINYFAILRRKRIPLKQASRSPVKSPFTGNQWAMYLWTDSSKGDNLILLSFFVLQIFPIFLILNQDENIFGAFVYTVHIRISRTTGRGIGSSILFYESWFNQILRGWVIFLSGAMLTSAPFNI